MAGTNPKPKAGKAGKAGNGAQPAPSQADRAYVEIRDGILKGSLPVGMALSRRRLAADFGISVPPVTEALLRLEGEGLVESKPRVGTRVRIPTPREVEDRSLLREALEVQAARLFTGRATPAEKKRIHQMGIRMDRLYAECDTKPLNHDSLFAVNSAHMNLHLRIADCARCPALRDAIEKEQVLIFNWLYDTAAKRRKLGANYHGTLTHALSTGSAASAESAMRRHIRRGLGEVLDGLKRLGITSDAWRARGGKHAAVVKPA
jgi:DNA-binding GntR family transcriptional regulator